MARTLDLGTPTNRQIIIHRRLGSCSNTKRKRYFFRTKLSNFVHLIDCTFDAAAKATKLQCRCSTRTPLAVPYSAHLVFSTCGQHLVHILVRSPLMDFRNQLSMPRPASVRLFIFASVRSVTDFAALPSINRFEL